MARCFECGRFALTSMDGQTFEAADSVRRDGQLPVDFSSSGFGVTAAYPVCCAGVKDFGGHRNFQSGEQLLTAIRAEHSCNQFITWHRGLSPKDHLEMKILAEVERRTLAWQQQQEALAETRHQEIRKDQKESGNKTRAIAIVAATAAIISALVAIATVSR